MIRLPVLFLLGVGLIAGMVGPANADDPIKLVHPGVLTVGTTGSSAPSTMLDLSGNLVGFEIDLSKRIADSIGVEVQFARLDFVALIPGLMANRFDMIASSTARTPERVASHDFIMSAPYLVNGIAITRRLGDKRIADWKSVCGLSGGALAGAPQTDIARKLMPPGCQLNTHDYPGWPEVVLDLENGRINYILGNFLTPAYLIAGGHTKIEVLPDILQVTTSAAIINKNDPGLAQQVDALVAKWKADGSLKTMTDKWFGQSVDWSLAENAP